MALFAGSLGWWIFVVIGIHVVLVFLFQTISAGKDRVKRVFIYMFSAFVFIFAYLQFNMKTRMKGQAWFPYSIYSAIVFVENSVMIMVWFFIQMNSLPSDSSIIEQESQRMHWLYLTIFHYSAFFISIFFMILTFCVRTAPRDKDDIIAGTHIEVKTVPFKPGLPMRT
ncbi:hypothetical protein SK128_001130 [Halocaridina rubra]|uniref:XK-related protein n=1 Tax=Halocaridina rubra TaxID=373956 RepID=A0AAN8WBF6_HALRR